MMFLDVDFHSPSIWTKNFHRASFRPLIPIWFADVIKKNYSSKKLQSWIWNIFHQKNLKPTGPANIQSEDMIHLSWFRISAVHRTHGFHNQTMISTTGNWISFVARRFISPPRRITSLSKEIFSYMPRSAEACMDIRFSSIIRIISRTRDNRKTQTICPFFIQETNNCWFFILPDNESNRTKPILFLACIKGGQGLGGLT